MATKKVDVEIDVKSNAKGSIQELRELRKALRQAAAGSKEFDQITASIRDTEDAIAGAKLQAEDFAGVLEAAPGPIGNIARGFKQVEIATKSWGAALKATGVGLLVALVAGLVGAFREQEGIMKKLEPLLIGLEQIFNGIFAIVEPLLDVFLDLALQVLPILTEGFKQLYSGLAGFTNFLKDNALGIGNILKGIFTFDADAIEKGWGQVTNSIKTSVATYEASVTRFEAGTKRLTSTERKNAEERAKIAAEETERLKEELRKREELQGNANTRTAALLLDGRDEYQKLVDEIEDEFQRSLGDAAVQQLVSEEEAIAAAIVRRDKKLKELNDARLKGLEQTQKAATDIQTLLLDDESRQLLEAEERKQQRIKVLQDAGYTDLTSAEILYQQEINAIRQKGKDDAAAIEQAKWDAIVEINQMGIDNLAGLGSLLQQLAGSSKGLAIAGILIEQAAAVARIVQSVNVANLGAIAKYSLLPGGALLTARAISANKIAGGLAIASSVVAGARAISQIRSTNIKNASATTSSGSGTGASLSVPTPPTTQAPQIQTTGGNNPTAQIVETLAGITGRPIKAYVVSGDVSSQQALDRRTSRAATFS